MLVLNLDFGHPPIRVSETSSGLERTGESGFCGPKSLSWLIFIGTVVLTSVEVVVSASVEVDCGSIVVTVASLVVVFGSVVVFPSVVVEVDFSVVVFSCGF